MGNTAIVVVYQRYSNYSLESCIKLFADDTNLFVYGKSLQEAAANANNRLSVLSNWFVANKLSLSVDK